MVYNADMIYKLNIPPTSPTRYVSAKIALNVINPQDTGDWHSCGIININHGYEPELYIYGIGQKYNTHHLLGEIGVIDGTSRFISMGYEPQNCPVWLADHPRACVDYLYTAALHPSWLLDNVGKYTKDEFEYLRRRSTRRVILDEWFPSVEDKESVYQLIDIMEQHLTQDELEILQIWKMDNPIL